MPNKQSAKKELRKGKKRVAANNVVKSNMKTLIKKSLKQVEGGDKKAVEDFNMTVKSIDKAVKKGIIKKNNAARKKSRLQKKVNALAK